MNDDLKEQSLFWDVMEGLVMLARLCFVLGYMWYVL